MLSNPPDADAYVDAAAAVIALPIPEEFRASVVANFRAILALARLVMSFPLPQEVQSAQVFRE
ncbi:MAG TPA: DUF4089 domain-containing protein [Steroidobacteraceae bacterium]